MHIFQQTSALTLYVLIGDNDCGNDYDASDNDAIRWNQAVLSVSLSVLVTLSIGFIFKGKGSSPLVEVSKCGHLGTAQITHGIER